MRFVAVLLVICFVGVLSTARVARADPHAVFYTAIGQQQLFFNVLAALDQAEYVETAAAREGLLEDRSAVAADPEFGREQDETLVVETEIAQDELESPGTGRTEPGTPTLLSRSVTLEGADLYTDMLVRMFGAESARRNSMSELIRSLCDYGLGLENCEYNLRDITKFSSRERQKALADIAARRAWATVVDPLEFTARPFEDGVLAAFDSGTPSDEKEREKLFREQDFNVRPRAYSRTIDEWRQYIARLSTSERQVHTRLLESLLYDVAQSFVAFNEEELIPYPFRDFDENLSLAYLDDYFSASSGSPNVPLPDRLVDTMGEVLHAQGTLRTIGEGAAQRIATQQEFIENEGLLADYIVRANTIQPALPPGLGASPSPGPVPPPAISEYGEITTFINSSVGVKEGIVDSLPLLLGLLDSSQQASSLLGLNQPGSAQLVDRSCPEGQEVQRDGSCGDTSPSSGSGSTGGVNGASTAVGGEVLGLTLFDTINRKPDGTADANSDNFDYDAAKRATSPSANIIAPHLEQGAVQALRNLTAGMFRGTRANPCGWTCDPFAPAADNGSIIPGR